jgi:hypothetical protein
MTRGREQRTAPILSHGQTTSGQCGFNQAASHPADPIKRHRARRERSHPKAMLTTQTSAVALDLLENRIGIQRDETTPGMTFEAAWGADGAVCVRHTRLPDVLDSAALAAQCPRLEHSLGATCDEAAPALLYNRSFGR